MITEYRYAKHVKHSYIKSIKKSCHYMYVYEYIMPAHSWLFEIGFVREVYG